MQFLGGQKCARQYWLVLKIVTSEYYLAYFCPSDVRPSICKEQLGYKIDGFSRNLVLENISKIYLVISNFIKIWLERR